SPPIVTLDATKEEQIQFTAKVLDDPEDSVTWSAPPGQKMDSTGNYTSSINPKGTTVTITATSVSDKKLFATATVILKPEQHFEVIPKLSSANGSQQIPFHNSTSGDVKWVSSNIELGTVPMDKMASSTVFTARPGVKTRQPVQVTAEHPDGTMAAAT